MKIKKIDLLIMLLSLCMFFPVLITLISSLMTDTEILRSFSSNLSVFDALKEGFQKFRVLQIIPEKVTFGQYEQILLNDPTILTLLTNSLKLAVPITLGNLVVSVLTAYGFTVWRWKHKEALFAVYTIVMLLPLQAVLVPNYLVATFLGIQDSYLAIILPGIFSPFGVFLMRQGMKTMPNAYLEAASIDGAGHLKTLTHIVLPQMKSTVAAFLILVFSEYWNIVEQGVVFITDYRKEPLSIYLSRLSTGHITVIFATSCLFLLPPLWMLIVGQEHLEKGIELSGVK